MSDISDNIIKILNDNGVSVQIENIWGSTGTDPKVVSRNINLDFSEHDKVFEDKIADLESLMKKQEEFLDMKNLQIAELKQRIAELESENEQLKFDIDKMATSKSEWIDKAVEWQQKCEKLESKETEKPTKINLNDRVKVKLTPLGAEIYYHMFDDTNKKAKKTIIEPHLPKVDEKGYTEFTLWGFINTYGQYIKVGKPNVIDPIDIIACE